MTLSEIFNQNILHHAYVLSGASKDTFSELSTLVENKLGSSVVANPDVYVKDNIQSLSIDDSREMKQFANRKPISGSLKFVIVSFDIATKESQNALLKLLEEPPKGTHFFFLVSNSEMLLPTLLSRTEVINVGSRRLSDNLAKSFVDSPKAKRLDIINPIINSKNREQIISFLDSLEQELRSRATLRIIDSEGVVAFDMVKQARNYVNDRGSSPKMLLEHLAITIPEI